MKYIFIILLLHSVVFAQVVFEGPLMLSDDGDQMNQHAIVELDSDSTCLALPNLTNNERDAFIGPVIGMLIYNTDERRYQGYDKDENSMATLSCCTSNQLSVLPNFNETVGLILQTPTAGPLESIRLRYFFNGSTPDSIRLVIASTPQASCNNGSENILSFTNKVPAISGWNTYIPTQAIFLNANDNIYVWPESINESLIKLRSRSGGGFNNASYRSYDFNNCGAINFDMQVELRQTVTTFEGWVDLH